MKSTANKALRLGAFSLFALVAPLTSKAAEPGWPEPVEDRQLFSMVLVDQLEYRNNRDADTLEWDAQAWIGGGYNRLWLRTEGRDRQTGDSGGEWEVQALYSRLVAPFWDFQAGLRYDRQWGPDGSRGRALAAIGLQGLAPYRFEIEPTLFISQNGDVSARFTASRSSTSPPLSRLKRTTSWPLASSSSQRCVPKNPVAPVTRYFIVSP